MNWRRTGIRIKLPQCSLSVLTQRGFFRQLECTEMKFLSRVSVYRVSVYRCRRRFDERKYGIREPLPDSEIICRNREPPEPEHVTSRLGYMSDLVPSNLIDRQSLRPFEGRNRDRSPG
jgi:hypothetical protein